MIVIHCDKIIKKTAWNVAKTESQLNYLLNGWSLKK